LTTPGFPSHKRWRELRQHDCAIGFADHCVCHIRAALCFTHPGIYARALQFRSRGPRGKQFAAMESEAQHALPQERMRAKTKGGSNLCDAGSKPIPSGSRFAVRPDAPNRTVKPKSSQANAASTTPAISRFTARAADMAKGLSAILPHT